MESMAQIAVDPRQRTVFLIEAAREVLASNGIIVSSGTHGLLSTRQAVELQQFNHPIAEKIRDKRERNSFSQGLKAKG
jgi:hypothetical protein